MGRKLLRTPELAAKFVSEAVGLLEEGGPELITTRSVARAAGSSLAALNDLFGSKAGLLDAVALDGFTALAERLSGASASGGPRSQVLVLCEVHREFASDHPNLMTHMYSRPFAAFGPSEGDLDTATVIRHHFTGAIAELLGLDWSTEAVFDAAVGLVALLEGLVSQQRSGILGSSMESADRRWRSAVETYLDGAVRRFGRHGQVVDVYTD